MGFCASHSAFERLVRVNPRDFSVTERTEVARRTMEVISDGRKLRAKKNFERRLGGLCFADSEFSARLPWRIDNLFTLVRITPLTSMLASVQSATRLINLPLAEALIGREA